MQEGSIIDGKYILGRQISEGGMGVVYQATHINLSRDFAIKFVKFSKNLDAEARFEQEAQILSSIRHPNIVEVTDFGRHGDYPYMVMTFLEGITLARAIEGSKVNRLPLDRAIKLGIKICDALRTVHSNEIIHRDITLNNIIVHNDNIWLIDFGVAKYKSSIEDTRGNLTPLGHKVGAPVEYSAPELQREGSQESIQSDLYSLGVVFSLLFLGRKINKYPASQDLPEYYTPHILTHLGTLLDGLLNPDPQKRISCAQDVETILIELQQASKRSHLWLPKVSEEKIPSFSTGKIFFVVFVCLVGTVLYKNWFLSSLSDSSQRIVGADEFAIGMDNEGSLPAELNSVKDSPREIVSKGIVFLFSEYSGSYLARSETTIEQYEQCVLSKGCKSEALDKHPNCTKSVGKNTPMTCVTYSEAQQFCSFVGGELPNKSSWLKTATLGGTSATPWKENNVDCTHAVVFQVDTPAHGCQGKGPIEVCKKPLGTTPQGHCDLIGNVFEMVRSDFSTKVCAVGGSWLKGESRERGAKSQIFPEKNERLEHVGFRCSMNIPQADTPSL